MFLTSTTSIFSFHQKITFLKAYSLISNISFKSCNVLRKEQGEVFLSYAKFFSWAHSFKLPAMELKIVLFLTGISFEIFNYKFLYTNLLYVSTKHIFNKTIHAEIKVINSSKGNLKYEN